MKNSKISPKLQKKIATTANIDGISFEWLPATFEEFLPMVRIRSGTDFIPFVPYLYQLEVIKLIEKIESLSVVKVVSLE